MVDTLADALGVRPMESVPKVIHPTEIIQVNERSVQANQTAEADFDTARSAVMQALNKGLAALDELAEVAKSSEHPRAYEVVANMVNTVTATADHLIKLHKTKQDISTADPNTPNSGGTNTTNVIVMSTAEMLRQIRQETGR